MVPDEKFGHFESLAVQWRLITSLLLAAFIGRRYESVSQSGLLLAGTSQQRQLSVLRGIGVLALPPNYFKLITGAVLFVPIELVDELSHRGRLLVS